MLLILAGVVLNTVLGNDGIIAKAELAREKTNNAQREEDEALADYENKINGYVDNSRGTGNSKKEILFNTKETGTREIQLQKNVTDYDFLVVYYNTVNSTGDMLFDTSESASYKTGYTYQNHYVFGVINLDVDLNKVSMTVSTSNPDWSRLENTYLTKVIGVKL